MAYCSACGAPRLPLTGEVLELAGKGERVGGLLAQLTGWAVLIGGLGFASLVAALVALFAGATAAAVAGLPALVGTVVLFFALQKGGSSLRAQGSAAQEEAWTRAVTARAAHRGGALRPEEAASLLRVPVDVADRFLTRLAKSRPDLLTLELDDAGGYFYRLVGSGAAGGLRVGTKVRVAANGNTRASAEAQDAEEREEAEEHDAREREGRRRP